MHTETARNIAIQRHDFMKQFINQFLMIGINNKCSRDKRILGLRAE